VKVLKFGGECLADARAFRQSKDILGAAGSELAVVVAAVAGTTDALIAAAGAALRGSSYSSILDDLRERHLAIIRPLFPPREHAPAITALQLMVNDLDDILHGVELVRECSARTMDLVMSFGEQLSCALAAAHMRRKGLDAVLVDAREIILTDDRFGSAGVDFEASYPRIAARLAAIPGIAVIPGFIGATAKGVTTTLGRNGSDYTASIIGAGAAAELIDIWTDVDGVLSADPRRVPDAFVVPEISYEEAMELSYFGAKVLHPYTMIPAVEKNIPIRIKNSLNPSAPGTVIGGPEHLKGSRTGHPITGIASIEGISLVNIEGGGMIGIPGIAARIFSASATLVPPNFITTMLMPKSSRPRPGTRPGLERA
jgi:aspartokinase/homoserine dehydrogenase 1